MLDDIKRSFVENKAAILISIAILVISLILGYYLAGYLHSYLNPVVEELTHKVQSGALKITFQDIEDCLVYISNSFSTLTSYANQTKKAITNKFIATAMTEFLRHKLEIYFIENPEEAKKIADQILINKHSREKAEKTRLDLKKTLATSNDSMVRVEKFVDCRTNGCFHFFPLHFSIIPHLYRLNISHDKIFKEFVRLQILSTSIQNFKNRV